MPTIPYKIQKNVQRLINGRKRWFANYETILIEVSDEVAMFMAKDNKYEQDYQSRMKKLKRIDKIHKTFSLDEFFISNDGAEVPVGEFIADTIHRDNCDPLEIAIEKETKYERKHRIKYETEDEKELARFMKQCESKMTKKQFETWRYHAAGFGNVEIAKILKIDESSVRERIKNAKKRIK